MGVWVQRKKKRKKEKKERKKFILTDQEGNLSQMTIFRTAWNNLVQLISELEPLEMKTIGFKQTTIFICL